MPFASALRVLIVDDQLTSRLLIRGGLQDLGVSDIEMASNGEEGFNLMKSKPAHLVISDFNMPKLDGLGFCAPCGPILRLRKSALFSSQGEAIRS